jgi:hypothetical protein
VVARVPRLERWRSHGELALLVAPTIAGVRARHEAGLVEQVLEGAGRRAVLGVRETLSALADARVDTLLVAAERSLAEPGGAPPVGADDTMLADAMIARAVATDASVVVLADETSSLLGDDVAALLRY